MTVCVQNFPFAYARDQGTILVGETKKIIFNFTSSDDDIYVDESYEFFSNEHHLPIMVTEVFSTFKNAVNTVEDEENFKEVETQKCLEIGTVVKLNDFEFKIKEIQIIYDFKTFEIFYLLKRLDASILDDEELRIPSYLF